MALPQRWKVEGGSGFDIPEIGNIVDPGNLHVIGTVAIYPVTEMGDCIPGFDGHDMGHIGRFFVG
jgi:hypothetical protein